MSWRGGGLRIAAALVLALLLAAPLTAAGLGVSARTSPAPVHWSLDALWTWARSWLGLPVLRTAPPGNAEKIDCEGGSSIDPNGRAVCTPTASATSDGGGCIDPDGRPICTSPTSAASDGGGSIDPNG